MAEVYPFRALHYSFAKAPDLDKVVTQPYDKITAEMQARYYDLSAYNLVRIIRGRQRPEDSERDNVYLRAARHFHEWLESGVLISEAEPALYPYHQEYEVPGRPGMRKLRRGFIGLCRLEDYSARVVHRHEETLRGPKADRLELLKATRAHFGQIFVLYSDPAGTVESLLAAHTHQKPWERLSDEYSTEHTVWRASDPETIEQVTTALQDKKLVIADGHHRYETALAYRDYCRAQAKPDPRAEFAMMTFIRMETDGLTILPTHRLVHSLPRFDWSEFVSAASEIFDVQPLPALDSSALQGGQFLDELSRAGREQPALGAYAGAGKQAILRLRSDFDLDGALAEMPANLRHLDVVILHRLVLERILGIDSKAVREERNLSYYREFDAAADQVAAHRAQLCLLLNPTPIEAVRDNALAGQVLPQKSTDFYPKLLSGLTIYWLENPAGM